MTTLTAVRSTEPSPDYYTIGYASRTFDEFAQTLIAADIQCLVDVRKHPVSMWRPEFSKKNIKSGLAMHGIEYVHIPELGVPTERRKSLKKQADYDALWDWYDSEVVYGNAHRNLKWYFNYAQNTLAIMCVEYDAIECHRHRLSAGLERLGLVGSHL